MVFDIFLLNKSNVELNKNVFMNEQKNALISVYNKTGIVEFAKELIDLGWQIYSSGGTARKLRESALEVTDVAELVGGEAILGHRVVTLSREVHAGLLADKSKSQDIQELENLGIPLIDLVCVDCYPLADEIAREGSDVQSVIEQTDIGGPTMLRSAAKGRRIVMCDADDRMRVIDWLKANKPYEREFITQLCAKAEAYVANYALMSAIYHGSGTYNGLVGEITLPVRYGENPWQKSPGLFKTMSNNDPLAIHNFKIFEGQLGYVNWIDVDRMLQTMTHIMAAYHKNNLWRDMGLKEDEGPFVAIGVKHGNACGAAIASTSEEALQKMLDGNLISIFGGAVITNFPIRSKHADILRNYNSPNSKRLLDLIVAPFITNEAAEIIGRKDQACKMITNSELGNLGPDCLDKELLIRKIRGGFLVQQNYDFVIDLESNDIKQYGEVRIPFAEDRINLVLAWAICSTSNSNTIVLVKDQMLIGAGVGQKDRLECCKLAVEIAQEAGHVTVGALACSDSFFPFPDGPGRLINAGIKTIFSLSGSVKDQATIDLCEKTNIMLLMMPNKEGRMFFGH